MLGKINSGQENLIFKKLSSLPRNKEYNIVHIGAGSPSSDHLNFRLWSRCIHLLQCEDLPHPRGGSFRTLTKKLNVKYSDLYENASDEDFERWKISNNLRSEESVMNPDLETSQLTGKQEFCRLIVLDIDLPDESVDYLIAVGLFSKWVSIVWKNLPKALSEARRVLKKNGALILTLHEDYFDEFSEAVSGQSFDMEILDSSPDGITEVDRGVNRMLLSCKHKGPPSD